MHIRLLLFLLFSCSNYRVEKSGGEQNYLYQSANNYSLAQLEALSSQVIQTSKRDPPLQTREKLFSKDLPAIKKIGIIIFESAIQPTRSGLSGNNLIYLSNAAKQLMTENFLTVWEQSFETLSPGLEVLPTAQVRKSHSFKRYGSKVTDHVKSQRTIFSADDFVFLASGKNTTRDTVMNPREMRDVSFVMVPAYELMGGPKWSEQNKHFLNDVARELNLDAVIIVMSQVNWTATHLDKRSKDVIPEELIIKLQASVLLPLSNYHSRLVKLGITERPNVTLCFSSYQTVQSIPVKISVPPQEQNFDTILRELLTPLMKTYKDLTQMTIIELHKDLSKPL